MAKPWNPLLLNSTKRIAIDGDNSRYYVTYDESKDGVKLKLNLSATDANSHFTIRYHDNDAYSIAPGGPRDFKTVICTSRTNYTSTQQYREPGHPLWLWTWLHGGNQFWDINPVNLKPGSPPTMDGWVIKNTHSGLYMTPKKQAVTQEEAPKLWQILDVTE